jgi:hypothetical protein
MPQTWRLSKPFVLMLAVIAILVIADAGIVAVRLSSGHPTSPAAVGAAPSASGHPCNHGSYVSRAAQTHKGGGYVSSVAKGKLGKNGDCSAALPSAPASPGSDD